MVGSPQPPDPERPPGTVRRSDAKHALDRDLQRFDERPRDDSFWQSLALIGTVGWSVALPTSFAAWFGHFLDRRFDSGVRFTLMLMFLGLCVGVLAAWRGIASRGLRRDRGRTRERTAASGTPVESSSGPTAASRGPVESSSGSTESSRGPVESSRGPVESSRGPVESPSGGGEKAGE